MRVIKDKFFFKLIGTLTLIEGLALLPCLIISYMKDTAETYNSLFTIIVVYVFIGSALLFRLRTHKFRLKVHEGFLIATLSWVFCSVLGSVPFYFAGDHYSFIQSLFESTAGFTTTGCTVMDLDTMPKGLIMWRAISNWLGGMGILVLVVSVLPALGISGQSLASTETTGPSVEKLGGRFSSTGQFLYITYSLFSIIEFILLAAGPLNAFDAFINTCSSISTGGLLITEQNAYAFNLLYVRIIIIVFTILSSMNYTLYFHMISGRKNAVTGNAEVRGFWLIIAVAAFLITLDLLHEKTYTSLYLAFKDSLTQVISFISTSGYFVCDYSKWPTFSVFILFTLLLIGGCSMSTSGSLKVIRVMVLFKLISRSIFKQIHPNGVRAIKISGKAVSARKVGEITAHILLYFIVVLVSCVILGLNNLDMEATITTVIGTISNTGVALGGPGPGGYYGLFSNFSLFYLSFLMIIGRLEIFAVIILFTKSFRQIDRPAQI